MSSLVLVISIGVAIVPGKCPYEQNRAWMTLSCDFTMTKRLHENSFYHNRGKSFKFITLIHLLNYICLNIHLYAVNWVFKHSSVQDTKERLRTFKVTFVRESTSQLDDNNIIVRISIEVIKYHYSCHWIIYPYRSPLNRKKL